MPKKKRIIDDFISDVKKNPANHCLKIKKLIGLIEALLKREDIIYSDEKASDMVAQIESFRTYQEGATTLAKDFIVLLPWQLFLIGCLYGIRYKKNNSPVFTKCYLQIGKKNGKTTLVAALSLINLIATQGAEVIIVNNTFKLTMKAFETLFNFVNQNELLKEEVENGNIKLTEWIHEINYKPNSSKIITFTANTNPQGLKPSFICFDEAAIYKSSEIIRKLESGKNSDDALSIIITTAATNHDNAAYYEYERAANILSGNFPMNNYLPMIFELDNEDIPNWKDKSLWIKANPSLGIIRNVTVIENEYNEALQNVDGGEAGFKAYCLNIWATNSRNGVSEQDWEPCIKQSLDKANRKYFEELKEYPVCGGLDLSLVDDMTAYTLYFYSPKLDKFIARHRFYIPEEQIEAKMKTDSKYIREWIRQGYIFPTTGPDGGKTINYEYIVKHIMEDKEKYPNLSIIAGDPVYLNRVRMLFDPDYFKKNNLSIINFEQDWKKMGLASSDWLGAILNKKILDANPVMKWMVENADYSTDQNKNIHFIKIKDFRSPKRIDGVITSIMSHALLSGQITSIPTKPIDYSFFFR